MHPGATEVQDGIDDDCWGWRHHCRLAAHVGAGARVRWEVGHWTHALGYFHSASEGWAHSLEGILAVDPHRGFTCTRTADEAHFW